MELPISIVTDAAEGAIINPVRVKDCDTVQAWRKSTYAAYQTPLCSPSKWSMICVDDRNCGSSIVIGWPAWRMTMSTSLLIQVRLIYTAALFLEEHAFQVEWLSFRLRPGKRCWQCNGTLRLDHHQLNGILKNGLVCLLGVMLSGDSLLVRKYYTMIHQGDKWRFFGWVRHDCWVE